MTHTPTTNRTADIVSAPTRPTSHRATLAGLATVLMAILAMLAGSLTASAAGPTVTRNHDLTLTAEHHLLQFNPDGADYTSTNTNTMNTKYFSSGAPNPSNWGMVSNPTKYDLRSRTEFTVTEKDSTGTISVKTSSTLFLGNSPVATTTISVDVLPNHWRSFWIYTDNGHSSYAHDLITITNIVS